MSQPSQQLSQQLTQLTQDLFEGMGMEEEIDLLSSSFDQRNRQPSWGELHDEYDQFGRAHMIQKYGPDILKELGHLRHNDDNNNDDDDDDVIPGAQLQFNDGEGDDDKTLSVFFNDRDQDGEMFPFAQVAQDALEEAKYAYVSFPNGTRIRAGPFYSNRDMIEFIQLLNS